MRQQKHPKEHLLKSQVDIQLKMERELSIVSLQKRLVYSVLVLHGVSNIAVFTIIFLAGLKYLVLPERLILIILANTIAQAGAALLIMTKCLFASFR